MLSGYDYLTCPLISQLGHYSQSMLQQHGSILLHSTVHFDVYSLIIAHPATLPLYAFTTWKYIVVYLGR